MSEFLKMLNGELYDSRDHELILKRNKAHNLSYEFNSILDVKDPRRKKILDELIPDNNNASIQGPIYFDYGINTHFGKNCYANFNLLVLDCASVIIGDNVLIGPNVSIYTATHPLLAEERTNYEYAKKVTIGNNVWIGGSVTICPGVNIGDNTVIGAGSVVTHDLPSDVVAAGNPCKVIRKLTEKDSIKYHR